ncbi:MAG: copper resistance CopC family protein, partial [Candidatus Dormibacteraceae bacterium]
MIATTGLALAHANLVRSDPPANASLKTEPATIQLWFSEQVEPSFSKIVVYDTSQHEVDRGDSHVAPDDPE